MLQNILYVWIADKRSNNHKTYNWKRLGQGPTHSKPTSMVCAHTRTQGSDASTHDDAKSLLLSSIFDPNPVIFLEHRWLHNLMGEVSDEIKIEKIGKSKVIRKGSDITVVSMSYMTIETIHAANFLVKELNIDIEIIDLRSVSPIDWQTIFESVQKTGRLIVVDTGFSFGSIAGEIIARVVMDRFSYLKLHPQNQCRCSDQQVCVN